MKVLHFLLLPYYLISYLILKPLARLILKDEIKYDQDLLDSVREVGRDLRKVNEQILEDNISLNKRLNRIKDVVKKNENKTREISLTEKDEIVIITYDKKKVFDFIDIFGEYGENPTYDSRIALQTFGDNIKIKDFTSQRLGFGYGRSLLNFTIIKAKESSFKSIYGDLSPEDQARFSWLIPFYESQGFICTLFENSKQFMLGKIEMNLENY